MTTLHTRTFSHTHIPSPRCSRPASPAPALLAHSRSREPTPRPTAAHFRLADLPSELQLHIFSYVAALPLHDLAAAARVSAEWNAALAPHLYRNVTVTETTRTGLFAGLGLDYLSAGEVEARAAEAATTGGLTSAAERKLAALAHVRHLTLGTPLGAVTVAEALLAHPALFAGVDTLTLAAPVFRHLVNSGLAAFGRPRSGSAFVGETLVARLRPKTLHIHYPTSRLNRGSVFDPVLLPRVLAVLLSEWKPQSVVYYNVGADLVPVFGAHTRINLGVGPCSTTRGPWSDGVAAGCENHGPLVRWHLRRMFSAHAHDELLETIAEAADPTDDDDLDPDVVPCAVDGVVEYAGVPCLAGVERETFIEKTFAKWPAEVDVAQRVQFFA